MYRSYATDFLIILRLHEQTDTITNYNQLNKTMYAQKQNK